MDPTLLQVAAFVILGTVLTVYALLDGFDLGIGMLFPWLGRSDREKSAVLATIAPVWDGNEVWLVMGGAYLFAFFPPAFGGALSILGVPVLIAVFALMLRAASFEFWYRGETFRRAWEKVLCVTSWLVSLILGIGFGSVISGLDITDRSAEALLRSLLSPLPLATGIAGCALFLLHGLAWSSAKAPVEIAGRISRIQKFVTPVTLATVAAWALVVAITLPSALSKPLFWIGIALTAAGIAAVMIKPLSERLPLPFYSGLAIAGAMTGALSAHFPSIIRASRSTGESLTAASSSSSNALLGTMVPFAALWILGIAAFTLFVYRTFKGRVTGDEHGY